MAMDVVFAVIGIAFFVASWVLFGWGDGKGST
jgi:hypothetical protein